MTKYRLKNAEVEAEQFFFQTTFHIPISVHKSGTGIMIIETKSGEKIIGHGDWVVKDEKGLIDRLHPEQFNKEYELVP